MSDSEGPTPILQPGKGRLQFKFCAVNFVSGAMDRLQEHRNAVIAAAGVTVAAAGAYYVLSHRHRVPKAGPYPVESLPAGAYDAVIVGAGPSGSTAGFYLARAGAKASLFACLIC